MRIVPCHLLTRFTYDEMSVYCYVRILFHNLFYAKINAKKAPKNEKAGFTVRGIYTGFIYFRNEN